jgi:hypothetical protein
MKCDKCESGRIAQIGAKCSDCCGVTLNKVNYDGYVPKDLGVGGGDYIEFNLCLDCGKVQGRFPLPPTKIESVGE